MSKRLLRSLLSLMVCMAMLLSLAPAALAESADAPSTEMAVGAVIHGFEVVENGEFALLNAKTTVLRHQKTGATVFFLINEDTNRAFDISFVTPLSDDKGIPHVFEHSTLDGSKKYPSASLFFNLIYQTYNTYMNAATYQVMTTYPVASLSEAQLLKYADFYLDSCFNPMIYEDESLFRSEAWRYSLESADSPPDHQRYGVFRNAGRCLAGDFRVLQRNEGGVPRQPHGLQSGRRADRNSVHDVAGSQRLPHCLLSSV